MKDKLRELFEASEIIPECVKYDAEGNCYYSTNGFVVDGMQYQIKWSAFQKGYQAAKASQWIRTAEEWPGDETLVMCIDIHGRHLILQLIYTGDYHVEPVWLCENHSDEYDLEDIKYWMPLPEGPTE